VLILMILYFVVSFINSSVQGYLYRKDEEELHELVSQRTSERKKN